MSLKNIYAEEHTTANDDRDEVNTITDKAYQRVHISFHSTSSLNISAINVLNKCDTTVILISRGKDKIKSY